MAETCYLCEYKRLAREAIGVLRTVTRLMGLLDLGARDTFLRIHDRLLAEFLQVHEQQQRETEEPPTQIDGYRLTWQRM